MVTLFEGARPPRIDSSGADLDQCPYDLPVFEKVRAARIPSYQDAGERLGAGK